MNLGIGMAQNILEASRLMLACMYLPLAVFIQRWGVLERAARAALFLNARQYGHYPVALVL